jgi:hypothetical protein
MGAMGRMHRGWFVAGIVSLTCVAGAARAQESAQPAAAPEATPQASKGSAPHVHDGFYLRLGAGFGGVGGSSTPDAGGPSTSMKGGTISSEIALGGTVAPGLVFGGGVYSMIVPSPKYTPDGGTEVDAGAHHIAGFGPMIDWYFDPTKGGHLQAGLLLATGVVSQKDNTPGAKGFGGALMIGGGYEFWVGEQWSIGPLARITAYRIGMKTDDLDIKYTLGMVNLAILFAATYH